MRKSSLLVAALSLSCRARNAASLPQNAKPLALCEASFFQDPAFQASPASADLFLKFLAENQRVMKAAAETVLKAHEQTRDDTALTLEAERLALKYYAGPGYTDFAKELLGALPSGSLSEPLALAKVQILISALNSIVKSGNPQHLHTGHVYRGATLPKATVEDYFATDGAFVYHPTFLSTSRDLAVAVKFLDLSDYDSYVTALYDLEVVNQPYIAAFSNYGEREQEVLIKPCTKFSLVSKQPVKSVSQMRPEAIQALKGLRPPVEPERAVNALMVTLRQTGRR